MAFEVCMKPIDPFQYLISDRDKNAKICCAKVKKFTIQTENENEVSVIRALSI